LSRTRPDFQFHSQEPALTTPKPGDRIRLVAMFDDPDPITPGTTGTVTAVRQQRTWARVV
jgi:hypothetical protein